MSVSAILILDHRGKVLISRDYREDIPLSYGAKFCQKLTNQTNETEIKPISHDEDGITYVYIKHNSINFLALTKYNTNCPLIVEFLYDLVKVLSSYFGTLEEESIKDNFVIIHELLDEMMDFGIPQFTESEMLKQYIKTESHKITQEQSKTISKAVTGNVSWRSEGIFYKKNEVFLDIVENLKMVITSSGSVVSSEIIGNINANIKLSGMPKLRLGLNDKILFKHSNEGKKNSVSFEMDDIKFHQCVKLSDFENDQSITFIPPDGQFELMSYRISKPLKPLFVVDALIETHARSRVEYYVKVKSLFRATLQAQDCQVVIPVSPNVDSPKFKANVGRCVYKPQIDAMVWTIRSFEGRKNHVLRAHFKLSSFSDEKELQRKKPIYLRFKINYKTVSGLLVKYLKIHEKSGYHALPWIRYLTESRETDYELKTLAVHVQMYADDLILIMKGPLISPKINLERIVGIIKRFGMNPHNNKTKNKKELKDIFYLGISLEKNTHLEYNFKKVEKPLETLKQLFQ
ncbi:adaptor protein complex 1 [Anaeramoeba flamelloides]|uniref:Adaptor protein complex 1 n=1 Tax=Anaeramoeba flamelloides TaxID=1746091 RepID=A0ABQ8XT51_9EUKA|nr:adaptor protein complex 1 [Anaeramoeba flamelloides]